jgi:peptidoglycan/xylan/chitin deacetylase (PgdA/CDA1 family)
MRIVSPLLKRVVYPALSRTGVFHRTSASGLAVVTYHGVTPPGYEAVDAGFDGNLIAAETLRRQLRRLKTHYNVVSPEEVLAWRHGNRLPKRAVLITCDDGLLNCRTEMLPVLRSEDVACLFFVTGASAGESRTMLWYEELFLLFLRAPSGPFDVSAGGIVIRGELGSRLQRRALWGDSVKRLSQVDAMSRGSWLATFRDRIGQTVIEGLEDEKSVACRRYGVINCSELQQLAAAGMTIGAHTMSHPTLSQLPAELAYAEIVESRTKLEEALQRPVWAFAYPFGDPQSVTTQVLGMPQKAGFQTAFLNYGGGLGSSLPYFALPRIHVTSEMSLAELEAHISGFYGRLHRRSVLEPRAVEMTQDAASR